MEVRCRVEECSHDIFWGAEGEAKIKGVRKYLSRKSRRFKWCLSGGEKRLLRLHKYRSLLLDGNVRYDSE